jgi:hypothetical protein
MSPGKQEEKDEAQRALQAIGDGVFDVMQTIVDGECKNKALGHCEEIVAHLKKLSEILKNKS